MNHDLFTFIKSRVAILDVVNAYTTVRKAGHYWKGACPFHAEKTPSFTVSPDKNIFYCFGCHMGGDAITFVAKLENLTPIQAVQHLAERFGVALPENDEQFVRKNDKQIAQKQHYWHLCELVADWAHGQLLKSSAASSYFQNRAVNKATITLFKLGYFPSGQRAIKALLAFVGHHNYLASDLVNAGILAEGKGMLYSPFEERLLFPIKDHLGRYCGFGGRIFTSNDERSKYYNSRESTYFLKGSLLFGFDLAKNEIQRNESVLLVEGYTDCIAMVQYGFKHTVATLGTACSVDHLKTLARYAYTLYVVYDGDQAGQNAIMRLTELCWQVNMDLKVVKLPGGEDPASLLAKGVDLASLISQAQDIFTFFIERLGTDFGAKHLNEKVQAVQQVLKVISSLQEPLKIDFLLKNAAQSFDISFEALKKELGRIEAKNNPIKMAAQKVAISAPEPDLLDLEKISELEKKLFSVIINNIGILQEEDWHFIDYFHNPFKAILKKARLIKKENPALEFVHFYELLASDEKNVVNKLVFEFQEYSDEKNFAQLFEHFQKQHWKTFVASFKSKVVQAEQQGDKNLVQALLDDFEKFKKKLVRK